MRDRIFLRIDSRFPEQVDWLRGSATATAVSPVQQPQSDAGMSTDTTATRPATDLPENVAGNTAVDQFVTHGSLAEAARAASGCQVIVLVPGTAVTLTEASIPSRQRQHIITAIPYALEDQLASDIESLHFAPGPRSDAGIVPVAVVARELMSRWLDALRTAGIEPDAMIPDFLALPVVEGGWAALRDESNLWLRQGPYTGAMVDGAEAMQWLMLALDELDEEQRPERIRWLDCRSEVDENVDIPDVTVDLVTDVRAPLVQFAANFSADHTINLIQGEYSPREQMGRLLRPWRATAALLLAVVIFVFAQLLLQYFSLAATSERLSDEIETVYRDTFPEARKVVDAQAQMKQKLSELGAVDHQGQGFMPLLAAIAGPLKGVASVDVRHASYQDGKLSLSVRIRDLQRLEQLKQNLIKDSGVAVEIQSAASSDAYVDARLLIWKQAS